MGNVSMQPVSDSRFEFDLADRVRRALRVSDTSVQEIAEYLEVNRNTVGNWINGRATPRPRELKRLALRTGFPYEWILNGESESPRPDGPDGGSVSHLSESNRRPIHYMFKGIAA